MIRNTICLVVALMLAFLLFSAHAEPVLALYMLGCDLESDTGAATADIMELLEATRKASFTVRARLGGSEVWGIPGLESGTCYDIELREGEMNVLGDLGKLPCATVDALTEFLNGCPDGLMDLILWGHGSSAGVGYDSINGDDILTMEEICETLLRCDRSLRLIGIDACTMAGFDVFWSLTPFARLIAACPDTEALGGWRYDAVNEWYGIPDEAFYSKLQTIRLRTHGGHPTRLSVLYSNALKNSREALIRVFDGVRRVEAGMTLLEAAEKCGDETAANTIKSVLDGQTVILSVLMNDKAPSGDIETSYSALLKRQ